MKFIKKALGIGALVLALSSCYEHEIEKKDTHYQIEKKDSQYQIEKKDTQQVLRGIPITVAQNYARFFGCVAVVLDVKDKYILAFGCNGDTTCELGAKKNAEIAVLIESEILDKDNDEIELWGEYDVKKFKIKKIKVQGYEFEFEY